MVGVERGVRRGGWGLDRLPCEQNGYKKWVF